MPRWCIQEVLLRWKLTLVNVSGPVWGGVTAQWCSRRAGGAGVARWQAAVCADEVMVWNRVNIHPQFSWTTQIYSKKSTFTSKHYPYLNWCTFCINEETVKPTLVPVVEMGCAEVPMWLEGVTLAMPLKGRFSIFISLLENIHRQRGLMNRCFISSILECIKIPLRHPAWCVWNTNSIMKPW